MSNHALAGYSFNLSEDGMGIRVPRVFPSLSKILIQIHIGGVNLEESGMDEIIRLEGTVSWASHVLPGILSTMGVKFSSRSDDVKRIYLQRINWRF